jgi:hypothetical protein
LWRLQAIDDRVDVAPLILQLLVSGCGAGAADAATVGALASTGGAVPLCRPWTASPCFVDVGASLRGERSGAPLVGKTVKFVSGRTIICDSRTDASGHASCRGIAPSGRAITERGYRVVFDADERFNAGSVDTGPERQTGR